MIPIERTSNFHFTMSHIVINFSILCERLFSMSFKSFINVFWFQFHCELHFHLFSQFSLNLHFLGLEDSRSFYEKDLPQQCLKRNINRNYYISTISQRLFQTKIYWFLLKVRVQVHVSVLTTFGYLLIARTQRQCTFHRTRKILKLLSFGSQTLGNYLKINNAYEFYSTSV